MLNNEVNLRFQQLLGALNKGVSDLVSDVGGTQAKYYRLFRGEVKPNYDTLFEVISAYPEINGDWLLTGRGSMFITDKESERVRELEGKVETLEGVLLRAMGKTKGATFLPEFADHEGASEILTDAVFENLVSGSKNLMSGEWIGVFSDQKGL